MQLINLASPTHNCHILSTTSSQNQLLHPAQSILQNKKDTVWISGQGLPQQILLSLQQVSIRYQFITAIAFYLMHDYDTNPKNIQIWTAKDRNWVENNQFVHWESIQLKKKRGRQMFNISEIPESQRIIKIKIVQTYGQYHTYLNQVMLLAQPDSQSSQSLLNYQEWNKIGLGNNGSVESPYKQKQRQKQRMFMNNNKNSRTHNNNSNNKLTPHIKNNQHQHNNNGSNNLKNSMGLNELSPLQLLKDVDEFQQSKNSKNNNYYYEGSKNNQKHRQLNTQKQKQNKKDRQIYETYENKDLQLQDMQQNNENEDHDHDHDHDHSYEHNAAMLAISKNMIVMEDNLQELNRKVDILEKKIQYTYQNLEGNIMRRVQQMIDKKLQKQLQKQLSKRSHASNHNNDYDNQPRRLKSCKDLTTSRTMNHNKNNNNNSKNDGNNSQKGNKNKEKDNNSYGLHKSRQKQKKVMSLVAQLNGKLKQRNILANKLQKRIGGTKIKPKSQYYD